MPIRPQAHYDRHGGQQPGSRLAGPHRCRNHFVVLYINIIKPVQYPMKIKFVGLQIFLDNAVRDVRFRAVEQTRIMKGSVAKTGRGTVKTPNAADIAKLAGVSTSAVYMSLRDDPRMNPHTRQRVRAVADHLNYRPKASARALATGRTDTIGVVFSRTDMQTSSEWFRHYAAALEMICESLDRRDFTMSLMTWSDEREELRLPRLFRETGVDGMMVLNTPETPILERILHRHGKPFIVLDASATSERVAVAVDEMRAAELAVEHLVELGHRRIAYIPLSDEARRPVEFIPLREDMFPRGYVRAMAAAGLTPIPGWDLPQEFEHVLGRLFSTPEPPTALLTYDDTLALTAMQWLRGRGLSIPRDVSVVALQDNGFADQCSKFDSDLPDITCKSNCQEEMARIGVEKLLTLIERPDRPVDSVFIQPTLRIRASTGHCPAPA